MFSCDSQFHACTLIRQTSKREFSNISTSLSADEWLTTKHAGGDEGLISKLLPTDKFTINFLRSIYRTRGICYHSVPMMWTGIFDILSLNENFQRFVSYFDEKETLYQRLFVFENLVLRFLQTASYKINELRDIQLE